jgi:protein O-mannosyl-transferase
VRHPRDSQTAWRGWTLGLVVAVVTGLTFSRSVGLGFVAWDDEVLLIDNVAFRGFAWEQLRWMASSALLGHWVPITWLSFAIDHAVWGLRPTGYHLTNVLLHAANAGLVCVLAARLLRKATAWPDGICGIGGVATALLWALHPMRVEAVSWLTGRRDVLCGLFLLLAGLAYVRATETETHRRGWLLCALVAYTLALGSKAVVMMLPVALIALEWYPLGRSRQSPGERMGWRPGVWSRVVPFAALAAVAAATSYVTQGRGSGMRILGPVAWLGTVTGTLGLQLSKTVLPVGLSPLYEMSRVVDLAAPRYWVAALVAVGITATVAVGWRRWPAGLVAWVWFLAFLAPVTAMAHAGPQLTADRYSYLPAMSASLLAGALVASALRAPRTGPAPGAARAAVGLVTVVVLAGLVGITWQLQSAWRDRGTLWTHAARVTPECVRCQVNAGVWLAEQGRLAEAIAHYDRALELDPRRVDLHTNAGLALVRLGRVDEAVSRFEEALVHHPERVGVRVSLVTALVAVGRLPDAVARLEEAARFETAAELVAYFERLSAAQPVAPVPRLGLLQAYARIGDPVRARETREALARLHPALASASAPGFVAPARP